MEIPRQLRDARQRLLWELARSGNTRGFQQLYRELSGPVMRYLISRLHSSPEAEDVAAEVFRKLVASLDSYDPKRGSVQGWVITMARNALIDHLRRARPTEPIDNIADVLADGATDALTEIIQQEEARFAHGVLQRYPAEVREMFSMHFAHGLPYRDIATAMGVSEAAVKQRFARTLRELRQELGAHKPSADPIRQSVEESPRTT